MPVPTASISLNPTTVLAGQTAVVTITFTEGVDGFGISQLIAAHGTFSAFTGIDGDSDYTAIFTPNTNLDSTSTTITLDLAPVISSDTLDPASGPAVSAPFTVDTTLPTVTITMSDSALKIGDIPPTVTFTFSEAVTNFSNSDLDLTLANGSLSAVSSSDGGLTYTATFTPTADATQAVNVITVNAGVATDAAGNAVAETPSPNFTIDLVRPTATITMDNTNLSIGEIATVTFAFTESVSGSFTNADLTIANGTLSAVSSSDGGLTYTAQFTPDASIEDATNLITLDMSGVRDGADNAGSGTKDTPNYAIDTARPTATIVVAKTALAPGETSLVTITFSEAVDGFSNSDLSVPNGGLTAVDSSDGGITYTATFTPNANVLDTTNIISLANAEVADLAGNVGTGTSVSDNFAINTAAPTAAIVVAKTALKIGETSEVTITFTEEVAGFDNNDLTIEGGTLSTISTSDNITWTATFTPNASTPDLTNVITLNNTGVVGVASGNAGIGTSVSNNYAIDTVRPTATSIVFADTELKIGDTSQVTFTFSEAVDLFSNADLTIANGTFSAVSSGDGGVTWTATFSPSASIQDTTNLITLDLTGLNDLAGNAGTGTKDSANYAIDTVRPTLASFVVADASLTAGETSEVTITFSEAVTGFTNADLTIANGTLSAVNSSDGGVTYTATFSPTADVQAASNVITLDNTGVVDLAGNAGTGSTTSGNFAINTKLPTATIIVADNALKVGDTSLVTITFSEAVDGFTNADLTIANGTLTAVGTGDGGITWTATFTPTSSITDTTNIIVLDNTGVQSTAGGNIGAGTTDSTNYAIDTERPTAAIEVADSTLGIGETSLVSFTFSEAVKNFDNGDLTVTNGTLSAVNTSDNITWTATFTPTAASTGDVITLDMTGIADNADNAGTGTATSNTYAIDHARPDVTSFAVADSDLKAGETSRVTITFSEAVTDFDNTDLTVPNGTMSTVTSSDGGVTWTADFTPTANIKDATNVITLDKSGVTDLAGNAGSGTSDSNNFAVSTVRPTATISVADPDNALKIGDTPLVTITFSEAVTGFDNTDLTVEGGTLANVASSDGGVTWKAIFTPTDAITDTSNVITLNNSGVTNGINAGAGTTLSDNFAIDTARPTATVTLAKSALAAGETTVVTIRFSEAVTDFDNTNLSIDTGTLSTVTTSDGGVTWTTTFTPNAAVTDATNVIGLNYVGIHDDAGNAGVGTTASANFTINVTEPSTPPEPTTPTPTPGDDVIALPVTGGTISAGEGADSVTGAAGDDFVHGNVGDDSLSGGGGDDIVRGGQGSDFVHGNIGEDLIFGDIGDDTAAGGQGADFVQGNAGNDYVAGDLGNDTVLGGQGADIVLGGGGDDYVSGDLGDDILTGGTGADLFNFSSGSGHDVVTDFSRAEGDHIRISPSDAANFSALSITSQGADTLITLGAQTVVLLGVSASSLTAADFVFA